VCVSLCVHAHRFRRYCPPCTLHRRPDAPMTCVCVCVCVRACVCVPFVFEHSRTHARMHACMHARTHTHMHTHAQTHMHTHTHTRTSTARTPAHTNHKHTGAMRMYDTHTLSREREDMGEPWHRRGSVPQLRRQQRNRYRPPWIDANVP
jgi:hypothetical protein